MQVSDGRADDGVTQCTQESCRRGSPQTEPEQRH
jgi:hypothetical protein